jgi:hypothetical protein
MAHSTLILYAWADNVKSMFLIKKKVERTDKSSYTSLLKHPKKKIYNSVVHFIQKRKDLLLTHTILLHFKETVFSQEVMCTLKQ